MLCYFCIIKLVKKSSTSLVQQLKEKIWINCVVVSTLLHNAVYSNFFLKLLDQRCWRFFEDYLNNFSTELSTQICCPRNFLIQEKQNGNVVSTSHWIRPVIVLANIIWKSICDGFDLTIDRLCCELYLLYQKNAAHIQFESEYQIILWFGFTNKAFWKKVDLNLEILVNRWHYPI